MKSKLIQSFEESDTTPNSESINIVATTIAKGPTISCRQTF